MTLDINQIMLLLAIAIVGLIVGYVWGASSQWNKGYKRGFDEGVFQIKWAMDHPVLSNAGGVGDDNL